MVAASLNTALEKQWTREGERSVVVMREEESECSHGKWNPMHLMQCRACYRDINMMKECVQLLYLSYRSWGVAVVTSGMPICVYTREQCTRNFGILIGNVRQIQVSVWLCAIVNLFAWLLRSRPIPEAVWASLTMVINFRRKLGTWEESLQLENKRKLLLEKELLGYYKMFERCNYVEFQIWQDLLESHRVLSCVTFVMYIEL